MGLINFNHEPYYKKRIASALKRRGLKIDYGFAWEVHGPHPGYNYQHYEGVAYDEENDIRLDVIITPHAVYEVISDNERIAIPTLQTLKKQGYS